MDDRQTRITEGAGLEESRLNQDFIEWLNIWGFRILMVVLVLAAGWVAKTKWDQYRERRLDTALVELEAEIATGSPDTIVRLAKKYQSVGTVWEQAMLNAAAINLESGRRALKPGGDPSNKEDFLEGDEADLQLEKAADQYAEVIDRAGRNSTTVNAFDARSGRIAALISLKKGDEARKELNELIPLLDKAGFADLKRQAEERLARLDELIADPLPISYAALNAISQQRAPIQMFGESDEDALAASDRMMSKELIEPEQEEPAPAVEEGPIIVPAVPDPSPSDDGQ